MGELGSVVREQSNRGGARGISKQKPANKNKTPKKTIESPPPPHQKKNE
jgi:hypothetical protein